MILKRISILNYKNLEQVELDFSPKMNCFIGQNGMGKTNLLDAVYYLSFCKSATNPIDSQNVMHDQDFFVIQGFYVTDEGDPEEIYCGLKRRQKKQFKRNKKEYTRLSDHIGFVPLVMVSPADAELIAGGSEERRRFMDVVISVWEEMMAVSGEVVYKKRSEFIAEFIPTFQSFYSYISQDKEKVNLSYESHAIQGNLQEIIKGSRQRDRIMGYSLKGIHRDDLIMQLGNFPIKREGSQGQNKTYRFEIGAVRLFEADRQQYHSSIVIG